MPTGLGSRPTFSCSHPMKFQRYFICKTVEEYHHFAKRKGCGSKYYTQLPHRLHGPVYKLLLTVFVPKLTPFGTAAPGVAAIGGPLSKMAVSRPRSCEHTPRPAGKRCGTARGAVLGAGTLIRSRLGGYGPTPLAERFASEESGHPALAVGRKNGCIHG